MTSDRQTPKQILERGWILTKEESPLDDRVVLIGYWKNGCTKLFFGCYFIHPEDLYYQWVEFDNKGIARLIETPDVWASIPQNFKGQKING